MTTAGYSGTPLAKKLGIQYNFKVLLYLPPAHYFELLDMIPDDIQLVRANQNEQVDFIHIFCREAEEVLTYGRDFKHKLKPKGIFWVSWPKGKSKLATNLNREKVREIMLTTGLVDIKVAAVDEDWSGLKFVHRKDTLK